jgi:hypothetical protein
MSVNHRRSYHLSKHKSLSRNFGKETVVEGDSLAGTGAFDVFQKIHTCVLSSSDRVVPDPRDNLRQLPVPCPNPVYIENIDVTGMGLIHCKCR